MTVQFKKIWYLPHENTFKEFQWKAMKDSGTLTISDSYLKFNGKTTHINIDASRINSIDYAKQGRDFVNNWVEIEYLDGRGQRAQAFFADGRLLGWAGIFGGTKQIYIALNEHALKWFDIKAKQ